MHVKNYGNEILTLIYKNLHNPDKVIYNFSDNNLTKYDKLLLTSTKDHVSTLLFRLKKESIRNFCFRLGSYALT